MAHDADTVERQLARICDSQDFSAAPKMRALLRYLIDAELGGTGDAIKAYGIGIDVFDRDATFDPNTDSIVRVQVGRLRHLLTYYYMTAGVGDSLRIDIPKGGYRAVFTLSQGTEKADGESQSNATENPDLSLPRSCIPVAVLPFTALTGDPDQAAFGDCLSDELTTQLAGVAALTLAPRASAFRYQGPVDMAQTGAELGVSYIVDGTVRQTATAVRVGVQLIDVRSNTCLWADRCERKADNPYDVQDEMVAALSAELRVRLYNAARHAIQQKSIEELSAWQLAIRAGWLPNDEISTQARQVRRIGYARKALELDPDEGRAHSVLADKLAFLANYDATWDTAAIRDEAEFHARRALELNPLDSDVALNVALYHWHAGHMKKCMWAARRALALEPNLFLAGFAVNFLPFAATIAPEAVLQDFIKLDEGLPADSVTRWIMQSCLCQLHLNNGDFDAVVNYGLRTNGVFALPETRLSLCAALDQLGSTDVAVRLINEAKADWPSLDLSHFANTVIPRRFGRSQVADRVQGYYLRLARHHAASAAA